jgi:MFS family permease
VTGARFAFIGLLTLGAIDATGYGVMAPVVPKISDATGAGPGVIGALVTCFAVGQLVAYPLFGELQRRRGATPVLALALALVVAGDIAFIAGDGLAVYFPARTVQGVGAGGLWIGVVFALMERFPGEEYSRLTALLGAYSFGGLAGPAIAAVGGIRGPFALHLGLVLAGGALLVALGAPHERPRFESDRATLRAPGFLLACAGVALVAVAYGALEGPLPLHFGTKLSQAEIALLFVLASVLLGVTSIAAGRTRPEPMLALAIVLLPASIALAGAVESIPLWLLAVAAAGAGFGTGSAGALGVLLNAVGVERIVLAMVVWSIAFGGGYVAGPVVAGGVAETLGFGAIGLVPAVGSAITAAVWLAGSRRSPKRQPAGPE